MAKLTGAKSKASRVVLPENIITEPVEHLIEHRLPWLGLGLVGGVIATFIISKYETLLNADIRLAFFIPVIVYLSDAVGTQAETIYIRAFTTKRVNFINYLVKETWVGLSLGIIFGLAIGILSGYWFDSPVLGWTLGLTILINQTLAPGLAVTIPSLIKRSHTDPALGAGPVATIIQDLISVLVYFLIATYLIF